MSDKPTIFVSYSHKDEKQKDYVVGHLKVAEKQGVLRTWDDRRINGGGDWRKEIDTALIKSKIAILLISHNSLTSDFILDEEVSAMLRRREADGLLVYPIVIRACDWDAVDWLKAMNLRPIDGRPLARLSLDRRDEVMASISGEIRELLGEIVENDDALELVISSPIDDEIDRLSHQTETLSAELGTTKTALNGMFEILAEKNVPAEQLEAKLREIAEHHIELTERLLALSQSYDEPEIAKRSRLAAEAIEEGDYDQADRLVEEARQFYSCFISYSHADKFFARRLHDQLQVQGIRCWLDENQLRPGDVIFDEIDRGIRLWDKVLLCCSEASLNSTWVNREIDKALQKEERLWKERGREVIALIPLDLDGELFKWKSSKASELTRRLAADFTGWEQDSTKFAAQIKQVIKALQADDLAHKQPQASKLTNQESVDKCRDESSPQSYPAVRINDAKSRISGGAGLEFFANSDKISKDRAINIELIPICEMTKLSVWDERKDEDCYHIYFRDYSEIEFFIHNKNSSALDLRNNEFVLIHSNYIKFTEYDGSEKTMKLPTNLSSTRFSLQKNLLPDDWVQIKVNHYRLAPVASGLECNSR